ncbi:MAG: shikimate dehydrogenase [Hydrogenibacillus sp.]|nr:shikimate dehydrogenase [Hydrogenibacillus sp.]
MNSRFARAGWKEDRRLVTINAETELYALFGSPVGHSLSPEMQTAAFRERGRNAVYLAFDVKSERLKDAVSAIRALGIRGVNVTIPFKEAIIPHLDALDESARLYGAVNTIVVRDGLLVGHNTDGAGYIRSLEELFLIDWPKQRVVLLGTGGAMRAVAIALAQKGVRSITLLNRTEERAQALAVELSRFDVEIDVERWANRRHVLDDKTLVVNGTPLGMIPRTDESPLPKEALHPGLIVSDLVYNPFKTRLLMDAENVGARVHPGIGMLVYQGALAYELWTGEKAPVPVMYQVARSNLVHLKDAGRKDAEHRIHATMSEARQKEPER